MTTTTLLPNLTARRISILERLCVAKQVEVRERERQEPSSALYARALTAPRPRSLAAALQKTDRVGVIAEIKRASPSKGTLAPDLDPAALARTYAAHGAAAISVLTDRHFQGTLDDLARVAAACELPRLRKDFILAPYQLYEARAAGADAVLLIVAVLRTTDALAALIAETESLGMEALVEVHDPAEVRIALAAGARLIGINNRDLATFRVDLATTARLRPLIPADLPLVSESGINNAADVATVAAAGARAVLVGESLVTAPDTGTRLAELAGVKRPDLTPRPLVPSGKGGAPGQTESS